MTAATIAAVTDPIHEAREVVRRDRAIQKQRAELARRKRAIIGQLLEAGLSHGQIAQLLDLSRQRVTQYAAELAEPAGEQLDQE